MNSGLKKSLYLGLAAVSMVAASSLTSTKASAKTYARITSNKTMTSAPETRNVVTNGSNALYTKAGTLRGARLVASKYTLQSYGNSKSSTKYFRAYRVATTNKGSVYYKVVSFNGNYRGWIYGGKSTNAFAGGVQSANTMANANMPTITTGYTLKDINKNTLWVNPKWSQYKAQQVDMSGYKAGDTFTVTAAATKTREGYLYYQVSDNNNATINGWVYADGLNAPTNTNTATSNNSLKINYLNASGQSVGSYQWIIQPTDLKSGAKLTNGAKLGDILNTTDSLTAAVSKNVPAGYTISKTQPNTNLADLTVGSDSYAVYVDRASAQYTSQLTYYSTNTNAQINAGQLIGNTYPTLSDSERALFSSNGQGVMATSIFDNALFTNGKLTILNGVDGKTYYFDKNRTLAANANARYGDTLKLYYIVRN
ncbi:hypothetical protein YK48G_23470 [Lentilactobacillus fungorum]|uniref:S-layer protein n=1 Tax=Lentilactobacillus fungorum TaxID=2201250 RepID=A0ABQ3W3B2_9LACO|nr:S-layer protein [Lentilactobacillus fungorum]GHP14922.1 hypothetical protein YK48G_23470 [Lentilactobacillus fungorum]